MNKNFVLDCSVAMVWVLKDEHSEYANKVLHSLKIANAYVPSLWWIEVCNILINAERRNRINKCEYLEFINLLHILPVKVERESLSSPEKLILICNEYQLTAYDGVYLSLALSKGLPIATLDVKLKVAALKSGCGVYLE